MTTGSNPTDDRDGAKGDDPRAVLASLRQMVSEEMFLLSQELEDSLDGDQRARLDQLTAHLDEVCDLMASHRETRRVGKNR